MELTLLLILCIGEQQLLSTYYVPNTHQAYPLALLLYLQQSHEAVILTPILLMKKLRLEKEKSLVLSPISERMEPGIKPS